MLFLITYGFTHEAENYVDFYNALESLGQCIEVNDGVTLCASLVSAAVIAAELRPHLAASDRLIVAQLYRGHCAGLLNDVQKELIRCTISEDPLESMEALQTRRKFSRPLYGRAY